MCLVIDTCYLGEVFEPRSKEHSKFVPVLKWISQGNGRMIYGGTKYNSELKNVTKVLNALAELSRQRRVVHLPKAIVDPIARALKRRFPEPEFNDEHIVALVIASRCQVVCTDDNVAISYLKRNDVFHGYPGVGRPKIFRGHGSHARLCCDDHVVEACR